MINLLKIKTLLSLLAFICLFTACKKETGVEINDEEIITTVQLNFKDSATGNVTSFNYDDADGPGGLLPVQDSVFLMPNSTYELTVKLFNKTVQPVLDITEEVEEEGIAHRFYYLPSAASNLTITTLDVDANGVPLGIHSLVHTGATGLGVLRIILRHYPGTPPDKAISDAENSPKSSTDVDVSFDTKLR